MIGAAGRIPAAGDSVEIAGFRFTITTASRRRIRRIEITAAEEGSRS